VLIVLLGRQTGNNPEWTFYALKLSEPLIKYLQLQISRRPRLTERMKVAISSPGYIDLRRLGLRRVSKGRFAS